MNKAPSFIRVFLLVFLSMLLCSNMALIFYNSSLTAEKSTSLTLGIVTSVYEKAEKKNEEKEQKKEQVTKQTIKENNNNTNPLTPEQIKEQEEKQKAEQAKKEKNRTNKIAKYNSRFRNFSHVAEFMSMGFLSALLLCVIFLKMNRKYMIFAGLFCFSYAISDEIHQLFVDGRSFQISDILLDTSGSAAGVLLGFAFFTIIRKIFVVKN